MGLIADWSMVAEVDKIMRATAAKNQVTNDKVCLIGWVDLSKVGVLTQKVINQVGLWCEKLVAKNPVGDLLNFNLTSFSFRVVVLLHVFSCDPFNRIAGAMRSPYSFNFISCWPCL